MTLIVAKLVGDDYLIAGADSRLTSGDGNSNRDGVVKLFLVGAQPDQFAITARGDFVSFLPSWTSTSLNIGGWLAEWTGRMRDDHRSMDMQLAVLQSELAVPLANAESKRCGELIALGWVSGGLQARVVQVRQHSDGPPEFVVQPSPGLTRGCVCKWPPTQAILCEAEGTIIDVTTMRGYIAKQARSDRTGLISQDPQQTTVVELWPGRSVFHDLSL